MTPERLAELRNLAEGATSGPWEVSLARLKLSERVLEVVEEYDLSFAELLYVLSREIHAWAARQVRDEREEATGRPEGKESK